VGTRGKLTRIVGGCTNSKDRELLSTSTLAGTPDFAIFFPEGDLAVLPQTGERYPARARPVSIAQWLDVVNPQEEVITILDPDMVNLRSLSEHPDVKKIRPGLMLAQRYAHGDTWYNFKDIGEEEPKISEDEKVNIYATGPPWMLFTSDLKKMLPQWTNYTDTAKGDGLMREQNAFNMAALKQKIPSMGNTDMMSSDSDSSGEAWDEHHAEPWTPYLLHYDQSYSYGVWEFHKALASDGWYQDKFENSLPTVIQCAAPILEEPPRPPTSAEEPDIRKRRNAFMIKNVITSMKTAAMAYRVKYCDKEVQSNLRLMRVMQPRCGVNSRTRYLVERPSASWTSHYPLGAERCSYLAQNLEN